MKKYDYSVVQLLLVNILRHFDTDIDTAHKVTNTLMHNEIQGYPSHGIRRIMQYVDDIKNKHLHVHAIPIVKSEKNIIHINGNFSFSIHTSNCVVQELQKDAQHQAVSMACVTQAHHLGRLNEIGARLASAPHNLIIMGFCNYLGAGARVALPENPEKARLCTNPLLLAFPAKNNAPFVLDMSTSIVSEGSIAHAQEHYERLPEGLLIGKKNQSIHQADALYQDPPEATIAPLGYPLAPHKGYGLAVFVEAMVGILAGAHNITNPYQDGGNGLFIIAINPKFFGDPSHSQNAESLGQKILEACYGSSRYPGSNYQPEDNPPPQYISLSNTLYQKINHLYKSIKSGETS